MNDSITRGRKFSQVLSGARKVFVQEGFEGASVDDIARAAGVSKATLYSYFPDKRLLFAEVARVEASCQAEQALDMLNPDDQPETALRIAGSHMMAFLTSELGVSQIALCSAEAKRFPELGRQFYEAGPGLVRATLGDYLRKCVDDGKLDIDDIELAADQFAELCKAGIFPRIICGVQTRFDEDELERVLSGAIEMFMARYGV